MIFELFFVLVLVSLVSFVGAILFYTLKLKSDFVLDLMVAFSVGGLFGGAFLHLLPELAESGDISFYAIFILLGIVLFYIIENLISWHHCHHTTHKHLSFSYMNLVGDFFHNFLDGVVIAGAFLTDINLGITTALAVIIHEIPQEIGDFGVLLKGGFSKKKALVLNFLVSLTSFVGAGLMLLFSTLISNISVYVIALAIGGFIYIAGTDLIPELNKCQTKKYFIVLLSMMIFGMGLMYLLTLFE
ncbi:MAG: ZIP family metal transporter [Candidatus ainarchaeum sp.]|nr:ZIP family metal transporter [Candidatus ainarchaeum sp.]